MHKIYNEVGLTTWMFHPKYSSNLHCKAMDKCVISEKPNMSKLTTCVNFAHITENHHFKLKYIFKNNTHYILYVFHFLCSMNGCVTRKYTTYYLKNISY